MTKDMTDIQERYTRLRQSLPETVRLVAVSKYHTIEDIREAYAAGCRDFGESRVQELQAKYEALPKDIRWHFIGHLQTNKVATLLPMVYLIHSVDSLHLLEKIGSEAEKQQRQVRILLEAHVAREETKTGFLPEELRQLLPEYGRSFEPQHKGQASYISLCGIMGMATNTEDAEEVRRCFKELRQLYELLPSDEQYNILSMGMSDDYRIAIEEGSTLVRIGSAIFA